ncbi:MAG: flagellar motor switch protein FliG [Clostridiales bacterium]|jgi:flagellar motor switch protein FliG|nr:flagellar motor switch protein FliG [Clostridiales bacterium]
MATADVKLDGKKKAAAIIIDIGVENAAKVYRYLRQDEIEQLTVEIASLQNIKPDTIEDILNEFYDLCLAQKYITEGGIDYARSILDKVMGSVEAANLIEKVSQSLRTRAFDFLKKADSKHLLNFIQNEHPQTIALILSYVKPEQSSGILAGLPREIQIDVAERIANMDRTSPDIIKEVERTLERKIASIVNMDFTEIGGIKYMAELLNAVDRGTEKYLLEELGKKDPKLSEEIRRRMFVFEDIVTLDSLAIQRFLRDVDSKDLVIALKGSNEEVQNIIYANMSKRMSETIQEDQQYLRGVRLRDVEEAQQRIVGIIRKLEEAGEIFISRGRKDEFIV